jgi:MHS family proline/betaine transporter-like MFS transporter
MRYASITLLILSIPLGFMLQSYSLWFIIGAEIILVVLNELLLGPSNAYLKQLFTANCRYRGVAFSFCLGMSLVGGLTPLIENWLYQKSGYMAAISVWLILISGLTWFSLHNIEKTKYLIEN